MFFTFSCKSFEKKVEFINVDHYNLGMLYILRYSNGTHTHRVRNGKIQSYEQKRTDLFGINMLNLDCDKKTNRSNNKNA